jgi:NADH-quinone oxidoreductase subunit C
VFGAILMNNNELFLALQNDFPEVVLAADMPCITLDKSALIASAEKLIKGEHYNFLQLTDLCGVDYLHYGCSDWATTSTTADGFSRARDNQTQSSWHGPRFAVVYHLLSIANNQRLRLRVLLEESDLNVPSVNALWPAANWFEREAFDLFGFNFEGHPDLRRILTDYNFEGHPLRKDFPLQGEVEMRYDATLQECVYEPVSIQNRVVSPRVIRSDNRYFDSNAAADNNNQGETNA